MKLKKKLNTKKKVVLFNSELDESLSDIDDQEVSYYILSNEEYKLKKMLWEVLFKDWIEEQKAKEPKKKSFIKKRSRKVSRADNVVAKTPVEAIINNSDKLKGNELSKFQLSIYLEPQRI